MKTIYTCRCKRRFSTLEKAKSHWRVFGNSHKMKKTEVSQEEYEKVVSEEESRNKSIRAKAEASAKEFEERAARDAAKARGDDDLGFG